VGDRVKGGALIGAVGRTGHATTNHLHFEVRRHGMAYDPLTLLPRPEASFSGSKQAPRADTETALTHGATAPANSRTQAAWTERSSAG
jgi:murein DD-endopeptidase MepM/ murein hydrolase activator NlpD